LNEESSDMTICLLGAGFTTGNMGVAALASGTIASVYYSFPKAKMFLLDYNKTSNNYNVCHPLGETSVELINLRFTKKYFCPIAL
jgi:colanic acid/amylovoran biosynthesis protein